MAVARCDPEGGIVNPENPTQSLECLAQSADVSNTSDFQDDQSNKMNFVFEKSGRPLLSDAKWIQKTAERAVVDHIVLSAGTASRHNERTGIASRATFRFPRRTRKLFHLRSYTNRLVKRGERGPIHRSNAFFREIVHFPGSCNATFHQNSLGPRRRVRMG